MILYICEKPAQARDIARNLKATNRQDGYLEGNGYQVTWCVGHLLELAPPEYYKPDVKPWRIEKLPVVPETWKMLITPRTKKQFNIIKQLLKNTQHVVVAGDPDRAGEAIIREILDYCHYQGKIERLWLSALDDVSIQKALNTLKSGDETITLYEAEKSRAASDYLLGLNLTMAASALYGVNGVLSIGRVQTPTLRLVVDRDRSIENFIPKDYFVLKTLFSSDQQTAFWTAWQVPEDLQDESGHCLNQHAVENVAAKVDDEPGTIKSFKESIKKQKAPVCFSLSDLQKKASALFGYSAKQVLELAQSLYETHKATSYPRTDCGYLPIEQFEEVNQVFSALSQADHEIKTLVALCDVQYRSSAWNNKKITAHHAIIPTLNEQVDIGRMSQEELNVYDLIRRQYLAQFLGDYEYQQRQVEIACAGEIFTATDNTPIKPGWKQAFKRMANNEKEEKKEDNRAIPTLIEDQAVENQETTVENKQTKPLARFTEGTLIDAMKTVGKSVEDEALKKILKDSSGIGTEATRANILETLFKRAYLERKTKQVISTDKGRALIDLVPEAIKNPLLTAQWEQKLEDIVKGHSDFNTFVAAQVTLLKEMLVQLQSEDTKKQAAILQLQSNTHNGKVYLCPKCQSSLRRLKSKKGKYFWGCGKYPDCDFTTWEKVGKPLIN
jgi:DNA topoisomerase III